MTSDDRPRGKPLKFLPLSEVLKKSEQLAEEQRKKREEENERLKWRLQLRKKGKSK